MLKSSDQESGGNARSQQEVRRQLQRLGERIRGLRVRRGMTRKDLSRHSGISERYLAQLETGSANPSISLLWRIGQALDLEFHHLLQGSASQPPAALPLIEFIEELSAEEQERAYNLLTQHFPESRGPLHGVALIGLRGAGKTTLGERLARHFDVPFVRLTEVIQMLAGMQVGEIFSLGGQKTYRRLERQAVEHTIETYPTAVLEAGGSLVSEHETFTLLRSAYFTIWVRANPEDHMNRVISQDDLRPMEGNEEAMADLRRMLAEREPSYRAASYALWTSDRPLDDCLEELVSATASYLRAPSVSMDLTKQKS